jgi:DNA-binding transcriptional LysR family regulator
LDSPRPAIAKRRIVYPHRRNLARRVQAFMDWVEEQMRDYAE